MFPGTMFGVDIRVDRSGTYTERLRVTPKKKRNRRWVKKYKKAYGTVLDFTPTLKDGEIIQFGNTAIMNERTYQKFKQAAQPAATPVFGGFL